MKIHTDITTLSRLYPLFKTAGLEGVLSGDLSKIKDLDLAGMAGALLESGNLAEICGIISRSDVHESEGGSVAWEDASLVQCLEVIVPFVIDITVGPIELNQAVAEAQAVMAQTPETSG